MNRSEAVFRAGDVVRVKSWPEIQATLDARGCLDGMPFMPEMRAFCGRQYPVWRRVEKTCVEGDRVRRLRHMVYLGNLRCTGHDHGGCDRECRLFWHENWLMPPTHASTTVEMSNSDFPYPVKTGERYICQSTELIQSTTALNQWDPRPYVRDVLNRTWRLKDMFRFILSAGWLRGRMKIAGAGAVLPRGVRDTTDTMALDLKPGALVETKSRAEIAATLDRRGRNRGLEFPIYMLPFCGQIFRVRRPVRRIILETSGEMRELKNTVSLECATCNGHGRWGGCPRDQFHLWREIWLKRVVTPARRDGPPEAMDAMPVEQFDDRTWDAYVMQHPEGTIFHMSGWRHALEATYPHMRGMFFGMRNHDQGIDAGIPAYVVDSPLLGRKIVATPFATKCGPLVGGNAGPGSLRNVMRAILKRTHAHRFELKANMLSPDGLRDLSMTPAATLMHHAILLSRDADDVLRRCSRTNVRQRIRRAQEAGLAVVYAQDDESMRAFHRLFAATRRRLGLPAMRRQFFENLLHYLPAGTVRLSLVYRGSMPVAGLFALRHRGMLHYEHMGYTDEAAATGGNQLLWWDGMVRACEEGLQALSLGCTDAAHQGLLAYKRHWGATEEVLTTAVLHANRWHMPVSASHDMKNRPVTRWLFHHAPMPLHAFLSARAYRHWG